MSENEAFKKRKNKKRKKKIIFMSILGVLIALIAVGIGYYISIRNQIYIKSDEPTTEEISYEEVEGITNVLLIGTDGRTLDEAARSDSIIIATLDNNNKKVKLTTIMRDTLVDIPEYGEYKINAAFALGSSELDDEGNLKGAEGGAKLLMETIENNLDFHLDKYVIVNFWGFEDIIDEIGGIDVEIKDYEIDEINKYIGETTGNNSPPITEAGLQTLNGQQALSYARIRAVGNGNFERGERQTQVLYQVATKLKEVNPLRYVSLAKVLAKQVRTNIDIPEALNLAYTIYKFPTLDFEQLQIPQTELIARDYLYKDKGWCLLIDLKQNAKVLYDFIYNNKLPNAEEFDLQSVYNVAAAYDAEEARYNALYNVNPDDYNDKESEEIVEPIPPEETLPEETLPEENENVEEKPSEDSNTGTDNTKPDNTKPDGSKPDESKPDESKPDNNEDNSNDGTNEDSNNDSNEEGSTGTNGDVNETQGVSPRVNGNENAA